MDKRSALTKLDDRVKAFEQKNIDTLAKLKRALDSSGGIDTIIASHKTQLQDRLDRKAAALGKRNNLKKELLTLQNRLQKEYAQAEKEFVPAFTELAHLFLGMDLEVRMDVSESVGLNLVVEVKGTTRRQQHNLSESQRFFIDIALRMAITQFISHRSTKGTLFIDTPEGSLDIAYEKRAGDMLSRFADKGHRIILTANLNSSKLLLALAHNCRKKLLQLCRMTEWSELSEVQTEEESLFDEAYEAIEKAMTN
jgi:DNA repair exonuclease SbcCD ATPase subunit